MYTRFVSILFLTFLWLFLLSCEKNFNTEPLPVPYAGRATINSIVENKTVYGFSFSLGKKIAVSNEFEITPDMILLVQVGVQGDVQGIYFSPIQFRPTFQLIDWVSTTDSARTVFNNLLEVSDTTFQELAIPVEKNQIWAIKTHDDKYAKILILETRVFENNSNIDSPNYYGEATFDWVYQSNGTALF